jgi:putative ABC transport system permease protein
MFKNYLKLAWRNLMKDRQFTVLNLVGLTVGLTCSLLIGLWVVDELNMEKYNDKDVQLYQVMSNIKLDNGIKTGHYTPGVLAPALKSEIPEIEDAVMVFPASWFSSKGVISIGDKKIKAGGEYIGKDYFNLFTCPFIEGDKNRLTSDKSAVAISETAAKRLFNTTEGIIGKTVKWDMQEYTGSYVIVGVFRDNPANATEQFDLLFNYDVALDKRDGLKDWGNSDPDTYVLVNPGTDIARLNAKIRNFLDTKRKPNGQTLFLIRFSDRYLYGNYENGVQAGGRIVYVRLFTIIAAFILIIACINFMNLSTAKAARRAKEVGIQKVVGAGRGSLILQYLGESVLISFLAMLLALILLYSLLPVFNTITGKQLSLEPGAPLVLSVLGITFFTGVLAGSYPAFYLSGFRPVAVLKGTFRSSVTEGWARKGLVVFQFTLSIVFIAAVLIIYRQVTYIQSRDLGYNRDHLIHFEIPLTMDSAKYSAATAFVQELNNIPGVANASSYYHNLTGGHGAIGGVSWPGKNPNRDIEFANLEVGFNFPETIGIKIKEGRNISQNANSMHEIIFNETAIKEMGLKDPIGKRVKFWDEDRLIVGIAADFNFESLYNAVKPCMFRMYPVMPNVLVKLRSGNEKETIEKVKTAYSQFNKGVAFDYRFLDEDYQALYAAETRVGVLSRYFAGLAILISCLGLFGLAAFTAQKKQKEIGIRKVIGASVTQLTFLLSKEFLGLVLLAIGIAFPLVWFAMQHWLDGFAYRVTITADVFLITGITAIAITLFTISYQSISAALANPVKSLRSE